MGQKPELVLHLGCRVRDAHQRRVGIGGTAGEGSDTNPRADRIATRGHGIGAEHDPITGLRFHPLDGVSMGERVVARDNGSVC